MLDEDYETSRQVLVVDDQSAFARSLQVVLEAQPTVGWVATAHTGEASVEFAAQHRPDVVVMDIDLPGISGIEATEILVKQDPDISVVVLTGIPDPALLARAAAAGAEAFLLKDSSLDEILDAVVVGPLDGDTSVARTTGLIRESGPGPPPASEDFSPFEIELLDFLAEGRQPTEIASTLAIDPTTCRGLVVRLLAKLEAHNSLEAVVIAGRIGVISLPDR